VTSDVAPQAAVTEPEPPAEAEAPVEPMKPVPSAAAPTPPDPLLLALATRAETDSARLDKARGRFTAQLLVACKPETVDRLLDTARGSKNVYVLPTQVRDEACFRVCFGTYATPKDAAAATDLPAALRGKDKVAAVAIAKVLP
jgi:septal ring-binding cell division protein DamX